MYGLTGSPFRNLALIVAFVLVIVAGATTAYMVAGWRFGDAIYMVLLTVYTVGYGEVRPINTPYLHAVTIATIVLGCTGMILVTGALVQALTIFQLQQFLGANRMKSEISKLENHVIVCGYGRIGQMLSKELADGGADFVIIERSEERCEQARAKGYLALQGEATDEAVLLTAGVARARILATVLPDDAANVFITLSARDLNRQVEIIARGEAPSTEGKLKQAGANRVVMPTHIGAERIAELILFPESAQLIRGSDTMRAFEKSLQTLGLAMELVVVREGGTADGQTIAALEQMGKGAFFVVQLNHRDGPVISQPGGAIQVGPGDGLVVVSRGPGAFGDLFSQHPGTS